MAFPVCRPALGLCSLSSESPVLGSRLIVKVCAVKLKELIVYVRQMLEVC